MQTSEHIYYWALQRIPSIVQNISVKGQQKDNRLIIDHLYMDVSEIIFQLFKSRKFASQKELLRGVFYFIEEIKNIIDPKKLLFVAMDGTTPAHMFQKINHRLMELNKLSDKNSLGLFELLPGTQSALDFEKSIVEGLKALMKKQNDDSSLRILFQGSSVTGDAQQKINDFIRKQRAQPGYDPNVSHCIYSKQTEAFLTALSSHELHFYILNYQVNHINVIECLHCGKKGHYYNECLGFNDDFQMPNNTRENVQAKYQLYKFQELRMYLTYEFKYIDSTVTNPNKFNLENVIDDFVLIIILLCQTELLGFKILKSLDSFLYIYKRIFPFLSGYMTRDGEFDIVNLKIFLKVVAQSEQAILQNFSRQEYFDLKKNQRESEAWADFVREIKKNIEADYAKENRENFMMERDSEMQYEREQVSGKGGVPVRPMEFQPVTEDKKKPSQKEQKDLIQQLLAQNIQETMNETGLKQDELMDQQMREQMNRKDYDDENNDINPQQDPDFGEESEDDENNHEYLKTETIKNVQMDIIDNSETSYQEILKNSQKYTERYLEGVSFCQLFLESHIAEGQEEIEFQKELLKLLAQKVTGDKNYKQDFYRSHFNVNPDNLAEYARFLEGLQKSYMEYLTWTYSYYYKGYQSWTWQYPFNHPPFLSDITENIEHLMINFEVTSPIQPLEFRLMLCLQSDLETIPKIFRFLIENKEKTQELGVFPDKIIEICHWSFEYIKPALRKLKIQDILQITQNYEEFLSEDDQRMNRKGKSVLFAKWEDLVTDKGQIRKVVNWKDHDLAAELFFLEEITSKVNLYGFLHPIFKDSMFKHSQQLPGSEYVNKAEFDTDTAEILDRVMYRINPQIKMLERSLSSQFDKNELYNKGLIKEAPIPQQSMMPGMMPPQMMNPMMGQVPHMMRPRGPPMQQGIPPMRPQQNMM